MTISITFFGLARQFAGTGAESLELCADVSTRSLIDTLAERHPQLRDLLLHEDGSYRRNVLLSVNGGAPEQSLDRILADGDDISIIPPVAGG
jgi:MoaD family protein